MGVLSQGGRENREYAVAAFLTTFFSRRAIFFHNFLIQLRIVQVEQGCGCRGFRV
jgi:hypothetical protein